MISYGEALSIIERIAKIRPLGDEEISLSDSMGRLLAEDLRSPEEVPSFTNSSMDGFAVFASDTVAAAPSRPLRLQVNGLVAAGDFVAFEKASLEKRGVCVEIMTGAPLPTSGFDAVIRIEDVEVERDKDGCARAIFINTPVESGENIRLRSTDFTCGQLVIENNTRLMPEHILACASLGISRLKVKRRPKVAIVSTGSELVSPETPTLKPGMIRNSTGSFLLAALERFGAQVEFLGIVRDDSDLYQKAIQLALDKGADIILSTGAVSMGKFDFVPEVLNKMGLSTCFHRVAIRPGKPILFGEFALAHQRAVFFGLPGNPISSAVGLRFFVEPYMRSALGLSREPGIRTRLSHDCAAGNGLRCFFKGRVQMRNTTLDVQALKGQASYVVSALLEANCWVVLPEDLSNAKASREVEIYPLQNAFDGLSF